MDANTIIIFSISIAMLQHADGNSNISNENETKWRQTKGKLNANWKLIEKREIHTKPHHSECYGALSCFCYSRKFRKYFCCRCVDDTCFPEDATVQLMNGTRIKMKDVRIGHRILTMDVCKDIPAFSTVIAFLERRTKIYSTYLTLHTNGNKEIPLSGIHLVFTVNKGEMKTKYAEDVLLDDYVIVSNNMWNHTVEKVVDIVREVKKGAYVPLTETGTLFVGGVLASCYASISSHSLAHIALTPVRFWPNLFETETSQFDDGVKLYVQVLKIIGRWLLPTNFISMLLDQYIY